MNGAASVTSLRQGRRATGPWSWVPVEKATTKLPSPSATTLCPGKLKVELPTEIEWSMFDGLDFDAMAKQPRKMGRPKRIPD